MNEPGQSERPNKGNSQHAVFVPATCQVSSPGAKTLELEEDETEDETEDEMEAERRHVMRRCAE